MKEIIFWDAIGKQIVRNTKGPRRTSISRSAADVFLELFYKEKKPARGIKRSDKVFIFTDDITTWIFDFFEELMLEEKYADVRLRLRQAFQCRELSSLDNPIPRFPNPKEDILDAFMECFENRYVSDNSLDDTHDFKEMRGILSEIKRIFNCQKYTLDLALRRFVSNIWKDGLFLFVSNKLNYSNQIEFQIGKVHIFIVATYTTQLSFSLKPHASISDLEKKVLLISSSNEITEDPSGSGLHIQNYNVPFYEALTLIENTIEAWPETKKNLVP